MASLLCSRGEGENELKTDAKTVRTTYYSNLHTCTSFASASISVIAKKGVPEYEHRQSTHSAHKVSPKQMCCRRCGSALDSVGNSRVDSNTAKLLQIRLLKCRTDLSYWSQVAVCSTVCRMWSSVSHIRFIRFSQSPSQSLTFPFKKSFAPDLRVSKPRNIIARMTAFAWNSLLFYWTTHNLSLESWSDYEDTQNLGLIQIMSTNIWARLKTSEREKRIQGISLHRSCHQLSSWMRSVDGGANFGHCAGMQLPQVLLYSNMHVYPGQHWKNPSHCVNNMWSTRLLIQ